MGHDDCVISDFGLAAYVDPNGGRLYTIAGSAGYSAPEMYPPEGIENGQGRGNGYGLKADMWSLGVIGQFTSPLESVYEAFSFELLPSSTVRPSLTFASHPAAPAPFTDWKSKQHSAVSAVGRFSILLTYHNGLPFFLAREY